MPFIWRNGFNFLMMTFYTNNGQHEEGPFTLEELKARKITKDTPIWHEGLTTWTTAGQVAELKNLFVATPPPIPAPSRPQVNAQVINREVPVTKSKGNGVFIALFLTLVLVLLAVTLYVNFKDNFTSATQEEAPAAAPEADSTSALSAEEERRRKMNEILTARNMNYRNNWQKYFIVQHEAIKTGLFGGIDPFQITVSNNTVGLLDEVEVSIEVIASSGESLGFEKIMMTNIPANTTDSVMSPSFERGTAVRVSISKLVSKKLHFCYPYDNGNTEDPHFCK
jgi:hypothetical protein